MVEVHEPRQVVSYLAAVVPTLDGNACRQELVDPPVLSEHVSALGSTDGGDHVLDHSRAEPGVEVGDRSGESIFEERLPIAGPLCPSFTGSDVRAPQDLPTEIGEVVEADLLDPGLRDEGLHTASSTRSSDISDPQLAREELGEKDVTELGEYLVSPRRLECQQDHRLCDRRELVDHAARREGDRQILHRRRVQARDGYACSLPSTHLLKYGIARKAKEEKLLRERRSRTEAVDVLINAELRERESLPEETHVAQTRQGDHRLC